MSRKVEKNVTLALQTHTTWVLSYFASAFMKTCQDVLFWPRAKTKLKVAENDLFGMIFISESFQISAVKSLLIGTPQE